MVQKCLADIQSVDGGTVWKYCRFQRRGYNLCGRIFGGVTISLRREDPLAADLASLHEKWGLEPPSWVGLNCISRCTCCRSETQAQVSQSVRFLDCMKDLARS